MLQIRKTSTTIEEIYLEGGREVSPVHRVAICSAIIANPWSGMGFVENLQPIIDEVADQLGERLTRNVISALDMPAEAFGKAGIVGVNGELEHASALIHTLKFGNHIRNATGGTSLLPAVEKRAIMGSSFDIPLKHIQSDRIRSHHQSVQVSVTDAPGADEILIALALSSSGRPQSRLLDFGQDNLT